MGSLVERTMRASLPYFLLPRRSRGLSAEAEVEGGWGEQEGGQTLKQSLAPRGRAGGEGVDAPPEEPTGAWEEGGGTERVNFRHPLPLSGVCVCVAEASSSMVCVASGSSCSSCSKVLRFSDDQSGEGGRDSLGAGSPVLGRARGHDWRREQRVLSSRLVTLPSMGAVWSVQ